MTRLEEVYTRNTQLLVDVIPSPEPANTIGVMQSVFDNCPHVCHFLGPPYCTFAFVVAISFFASMTGPLPLQLFDTASNIS